MGKFAGILGRDGLSPDADMVAAAEAGCKFTKTYPIESTCDGQFLYLVRDNTKTIKEFCVQDITNPNSVEILTKLPKESVIPVQK